MNRAASKTYVLRGYVRPMVEDRFLGVCVKPYLVVEGHTKDETLIKLRDLMSAYLDDAMNDGDERALRRRAPLRYWLEYGALRCAMLIHWLRRTSFAFSETRNVTLHHA